MPSHDRLPIAKPQAGHSGDSPPFCLVEKENEAGGSRHFVVHVDSPKFVVEFEESAKSEGSASGDAPSAGGIPVIRRVCVPNSWSGDYHRCARKIAAAMSFFQATRARKA